MKKINISILIANYNGEKYLERCINSCIQQKTKKKYEIIFIDDRSTDNSLELVKKYKNKIRIIKTNKKKNVSNFNTFYQLNTYYSGFKKARGKIICFLDSDDYLKKNKLSQIEFHFSKNPKLNFIFDQPILVNFDRQIKISKKKYGFRDKIWPCFPPQSCISVKRNIIQNNIKKLFIKKFNLTTLDFRIASLADIYRKNCLFLNKSLTYYFQHDKSESLKNFKMLSFNWFRRRKEAYKYYRINNKKKFLTLDYFFTIIITYFFESINFYKNKISRYLSKIM